MNDHHHSLLSKGAILEQLGRGIIIDPFDEEQLKSCSYDVRLGRYYFKRVAPSTKEGPAIYNPYSDTAQFEGPFEARPASELDFYDPDSKLFRGIDPEDRLIFWAPGENILGHTEEFTGGTHDPETGRCFTSEMKARSTVARVGLQICHDAGWGDVGYINRWTMELTNGHPCVTFLVVGTRVGQMKFYEVDPIDPEDMYGFDGSRDQYQRGMNLEQIKAAWRPEMLLPRLKKD